MILSLYAPDQEENIYIRRRAETWRRSDLITKEQHDAVNDATGVYLRRTNLFFRLLFFIFTLVCTGALTGLMTWLVFGSHVIIFAVILIVFGAFYYVIAEFLAGRRRLYRHGIEEALAVMGMLLFCVGFGLLVDDLGFRVQTAMRLATFLCAVISLWICLRFGYVYAGVICICALCAMPFQFSLSPAAERLILLGILCVAFLAVLIAGGKMTEDFKKERNILILTGIAAAIYLDVNLHVFGLIESFTSEIGALHFNPKSFPPWFYWSSYVLTFLIPAALIYRGLKSRWRCMLNGGLFMAVVTLGTNKSYLELTRYAWDPAILGIVLIVLSLGLTKWLNTGPEEKRFGFTAKDILKPDHAGINPADVAAAMTPSLIAAHQPSEAPRDQVYEGGASGGGGTQRDF